MTYSKNPKAQAPFFDPKDIITPHAFKIDPRLLGLTLAVPMRRGWAILLDALFVSMLATSGGVILGLVLAVLFYGWLKKRYRWANRWARGGQAVLGVLGAILIFALVAGNIQPLWERYMPRDDLAETPEIVHNKDNTKVNIGGMEGVKFGAYVVKLQACDDAICRFQTSEAMTELMKGLDMPTEDKIEELKQLTADAAEDQKEKIALHTMILNKLGQPAAGTKAEEPEEKPVDPVQLERAADKKLIAQLESENGALKAEQEGFSVLKTVRNLAEDMGLGFGWGAVYFTLFTSWWGGQTPGKRLLGIRVVHLNGKPITIWDAFSRYGGYTAGLATGLLGFAQCLWDPNRQAIHDKIAFTAVIRDRDGKALQRAVAAPEDADFGDVLDKLDQEAPST